jgi:methionyl-tRNA synthetase
MKQVGVDGLRYFLIREAPLEADSNYSADLILKRVNSDLANDLGNLVSRSLTMIQRYCEGRIPHADPSLSPPFRDNLEMIVQSLSTRVQNFDFPHLLSDIWEVIGSINRYIVEEQPWVLAKDTQARERLQTVLYNVCEGVRIIAGLLAPVVPDSADAIWDQLGLTSRASAAQTPDLEWGKLAEGTTIRTVVPVFPRIEENQEQNVTEPSVLADAQNQVSIEDFQKLGLKVAVIQSAEKIPGSKKLLKLSVDLGSEVRTVVAGIAEAYSPEELIGKQVIVVTNLKPVRLMGVESNGMILAASLEGKPVLASVTQTVPKGTPVK